MQIQKIFLILILALFLIGGCSPDSKAKPTSTTIVTSKGAMTQPYQVNTEPTSDTSQPLVSTSIVPPISTIEIQAAPTTESDDKSNPEESFPLAPNTQFDPGNGGSEEQESSGAFMLHSKGSLEIVNKFYQSALPKQGWKLRYIDANHGGGVTQYWEQGQLFMSIDLAFDNTGLAIQVQWHQLDSEAIKLLPKDLPLPDQSEILDATDTTWEVYILQESDAVVQYYQREAAVKNWKPESASVAATKTCESDCGGNLPSFPPGVTPMPTATPDLRQSQVLAYTMTDGNEISLELIPHRDATILNITFNPEECGIGRATQRGAFISRGDRYGHRSRNVTLYCPIRFKNHGPVLYPGHDHCRMETICRLQRGYD